MVDSSRQKSPSKALWYSIIPGAGQLYNQHPLKAILFSGVFAYFTYEYLNAQEAYQVDPADKSLHRIRNDKIWLMSLTWTMNILDAYVDAQLWDFEKYRISTEALPETELIKPKETDSIDDTE
ncbi:MAG: DUF5683 domain-containing protein [Candidatus Marinimicrobia bacterium]|nr:DUF5683 domain-containing protein [Candidatus Neomarinimicrobiota bacterium]